MLLAGATLLGLGCSEPTSPSRTGTYGFDVGGDIFHWPTERLPVRYYAQPTGNLRVLVQHAIDSWASVFLYGEFTGTIVPDSTRADVIVAADSAPDVPPDLGAPVYACTGATSVPAVGANNHYSGPFHIQLTVLSGYTAAQAAACLRRTAIHEVGHSLGLFQHSPDLGDIMHGPPQVAQPSDQDRRTVEVLYHTLPTVLPPP
jgi:predicted Zn-dependent protease